jgi:hypothetical protein
MRLPAKGLHSPSEVIEREGVHEVTDDSREPGVGHFELSHSIGQTIAQRRLESRRSHRPVLQDCFDFLGQAMQRVPGLGIEVVRLSELGTERRHPCSERLF